MQCFEFITRDFPFECFSAELLNKSLKKLLEFSFYSSKQYELASKHLEELSKYIIAQYSLRSSDVNVCRHLCSSSHQFQGVASLLCASTGLFQDILQEWSILPKGKVYTVVLHSMLSYLSEI